MKKKKLEENYLERIPLINDKYSYKQEEDGKISIIIYNRGFFNRIAQKLFKKPKVSYVHLDENGSFIWKHINGVNSVGTIADFVRSEFGEKSEPLYERLIKYTEILASYGFIIWKE